MEFFRVKDICAGVVAFCGGSFYRGASTLSYDFNLCGDDSTAEAIVSILLAGVIVPAKAFSINGKVKESC